MPLCTAFGCHVLSLSFCNLSFCHCSIYKQGMQCETSSIYVYIHTPIGLVFSKTLEVMNSQAFNILSVSIHCTQRTELSKGKQDLSFHAVLTRNNYNNNNIYIKHL